MEKKIIESTKNAGVVTNCDHRDLMPIENRIISLRGYPVILDKDLAELYGVETRALNQAVSRNIERFPLEFRFQIAKEEMAILKSQIVTSSWGGTRKMPFAFTEQGVAMLSALLKSPRAVATSVAIMKAFVAMRRYMMTNAQLFQRLERVEYRQHDTDEKIAQLFDRLDEGGACPKQNVFFDGQIYDAYEFVSKLIRSAKARIILIDNYVNDEVLTMLTKRAQSVKATIYTKTISSSLRLDIDKHNAQYPPVDVIAFNKAHDRFLMIDDKVYLIGASLKDLGKKWFAFSLMKDLTPETLLERIVKSQFEGGRD